MWETNAAADCGRWSGEIQIPVHPKPLIHPHLHMILPAYLTFLFGLVRPYKQNLTTFPDENSMNLRFRPPYCVKNFLAWNKAFLNVPRSTCRGYGVIISCIECEIIEKCVRRKQERLTFSINSTCSPITSMAANLPCLPGSLRTAQVPTSFVPLVHNLGVG